MISWLFAIVFLGHGLLLAGEYFVNNGTGPPARIGKSVLIAIIGAPITVSVVLFLAGCSWIADSKNAMRWTLCASALVVVYVLYFLWFIL